MVKILLALGIAAVLGIATAMLTVMFSARSMHWFGNLNTTEQKGYLYAFLLVSVLLIVYNGWRLWRRSKSRRKA
jgi:uncharacterized membrane protein YphA (DoxX/SURF4 family)